MDVGDNRYNIILLCSPPPIAQGKAFLHEINFCAVSYTFMLFATTPLIFFCRSNLEDMKNWRKCDICFEWKHKKSINRHKKIVHNTTKHMCDSCGLVVNSSEKLESHILKCHTNVVAVHCEICDKVFVNKQKANYHKSRMHNSREGTDFKCSECSKEYSSRANLYRHINAKHKK